MKENNQRVFEDSFKKKRHKDAFKDNMPTRGH